MHVAKAKIANSSKTLRPQLSDESGSDDDLEDIDDILDSLKAHILCLTDLAPHLHSMTQISARPKAVGPLDPSVETSVKEGSENPNQESSQKGLNLSGSQVALEPQRSTPDAHGQQIICHHDISSEAPGISSRTSNHSKSPPVQSTATATAATPNNQIHNSIQSQDKQRQLGQDQYELQQVGRDQSMASATAAPREPPSTQLSYLFAAKEGLNPKQYQRILKRRESRLKLEAAFRASEKSKQHGSLMDHIIKRSLGP